eukprot:s792_g17.t1
MLVICAVAIWEGCKSAVKSRGEAERLRSVAGSQDRQRLTKVELRTLSALLQRDRQTLTRDERMDLIHLAGLCGSDVSEAVGMSVATPATGRPLRTVPEATCSAGIDPAAEDTFDMPPPPPPEVPRPAKKSSKMSPTAPLSSWENPVWTERPELVKCPRRSPERRQCDAAVQCELLGMVSFAYGVRYRKIVGDYVCRYWFLVLIAFGLTWPPSLDVRLDVHPTHNLILRSKAEIMETVCILAWLCASDRFFPREIFTEDRLGFLNDWALLLFLVHKAVHMIFGLPLSWFVLIGLMPVAWVFRRRETQ